MGRKTKDKEHQTASQILEGSVIKACRMISELVAGKRKRINQLRYNAAIFNIEQCLGKARQKIEHSGGILTYAQLAKSAADLDTKPRPILADVLEIANKYDREHPEPAPSEEHKEQDSSG